MKIRVDTTRCMGNGFCEAIAEDVFEIGPDSVVHLLADEVPEKRRNEMRQAVEQCPVDAITVDS